MRAVILTSHEGEFGIQSSIRRLESGASALDAIEAGIRDVEDDHRARTVGFGGAPNIWGEMELDAAIMDGKTLQAGCIGAIQHSKHPISVARRVMEVLPHVFLVGAGADHFSKEQGLEQADMLSPESRHCWQVWIENNVSSADREQLKSASIVPYMSFASRRDLSKGTVTFLVRDFDGNIAGGVSTSGWAYKYPGRLGDSPVIGAGMYVDNRYGGVSCTHTGEMTIRAGTARSVITYVKRGANIVDACHEAMEDLKDLKGGYLGPVMLHAMDKYGQTCVLTTGGEDGDKFWEWDSEIKEARQGSPKLS